MNVKNLFTRAGAGIIYILVVLLGVLGGRYFFLTIFGMGIGIALYELFRMMEKKTTHAISKAFNIVSGILIFFSVFLLMEKICVFALPFFILLYLLILFTSAIFINRYDILHAIVFSVFGQIYITLPISLLMYISYQHVQFNEQFSYVLILAIFIFIWVNDTAAYFIGSLIGKHKFIERISPNKSTEGFISGIIFSVLAAIVFSEFHTNYSVLFWMGFALVTALFGTIGDLFESLLKRTYEVKDTGTLIPGHGGILDRIDSLLIAIPAVFLYLMVFQLF